VIRGFCSARSSLQAPAVVMFEAYCAIALLHVGKSAAQEWSRVWVTRVTDFSVWKKELEFCWVVG
jgi:hypothetical protein